MTCSNYKYTFYITYSCILSDMAELVQNIKEKQSRLGITMGTTLPCTKGGMTVIAFGLLFSFLRVYDHRRSKLMFQFKPSGNLTICRT